jgi:hypothetical protein
MRLLSYCFLSDDEYSTQNLAKFLLLLWEDKFNLLEGIWPLLVPIVGFVIFLWRNGSIVLGDKENHKAGVHLAMFAHNLALIGGLALVRGIDEVTLFSSLGMVNTADL